MRKLQYWAKDSESVLVQTVTVVHGYNSI